jgi:hypothetical protein
VEKNLSIKIRTDDTGQRCSNTCPRYRDPRQCELPGTHIEQLSQGVGFVHGGGGPLRTALCVALERTSESRAEE